MGYVGSDDGQTTSTERKRVATVDSFETEPFDSQLSPASSPCEWFLVFGYFTFQDHQFFHTGRAKLGSFFFSRFSFLW